MSDRVLFVDDEENILKSIKRLFFEEDFEILLAKSGQEGLEIIKNNEVAVIVSDQRMPEMSGSEFLEQAKEISPDSIRIVLTGYADVNAAIDAINKGGAFRYITKPWHDADLILTIKQAIEQYRLIKENKYLTELTKKQNEELKRWSSELEIYVQEQTIELTKQNQKLELLNEKLNRNFRDFISTLCSLNELRNVGIRKHSDNVAKLCKSIGEKIGLKEKEQEDLIIAAELHDIGKIGISDFIVSKDIDSLNKDEIKEYRKHPILGQTVVGFVEDLRQVGLLIRHHHESYNGTGFPDGLAKDDIPMGSRIIYIVDSFERLSTRSREIDLIEKALSTIKTSLRSEFDPSLFGVLQDVIKDNLDNILTYEGFYEVEISLKDLRPGMVVARDVMTGTGLLILKEGTVMDSYKIEIVKRSAHFDPLKTGIFIRVEK